MVFRLPLQVFSIFIITFGLVILPKKEAGPGRGPALM